jgi:hypothetical protein
MYVHVLAVGCQAKQACVYGVDQPLQVWTAAYDWAQAVCAASLLAIRKSQQECDLHKLVNHWLQLLTVWVAD